MCEIISIKAATIIPFINEILGSGKSVKIVVTGMSMYPFLREGIDSVELMQADFSAINRGDIVIILRSSGQYVMHRVEKKGLSCFYIAGDAQRWIEGPLQQGQLIAAVSAVWRKNKRIECTNFWWNLLSRLWLWLIPFRCIIIGAYRRLSRVCRYFKRGGTLYEKKF